MTNNPQFTVFKMRDDEDRDRLQASLESVLVWAEDAIAFKRNYLQFRWATLREYRDKNWKPGTRGDMQIAAYADETIAREEREFEAWRSPVSEANKMLDLFIDATNPVDSPSTPERVQCPTEGNLK